MNLTDEQVAKLPKWAKSAFDQKDREIRDLQEALDTLRGSAKVDNQVGELLQSGYRSEPIPLGEYFRVNVGNLTISMSQGRYLSISSQKGWPAVVPSVSNVVYVTTIDRDI